MKCVHTFGTGRHKRQVDITYCLSIYKSSFYVLRNVFFAMITFFINMFSVKVVEDLTPTSPTNSKLVAQTDY